MKDKVVVGSNSKCRCGGRLKAFDHNRDRTAWTMRCGRCGHFSLSWVFLLVPLQDFHLKRGPMGRPYDDYAMALALKTCLEDTAEPTPAMIVDWGISSPRHYEGLQSLVVRGGADEYLLDRVIGDGPAITCVVQGVLDRSVPIVYRTFYDAFVMEPEDWDDL